MKYRIDIILINQTYMSMHKLMFDHIMIEIYFNTQIKNNNLRFLYLYINSILSTSLIILVYFTF